jgi:RimJ/RimL family protein N-acetyltransferase
LLQTDRLTIRNFTLADANDLYEYLSLPDTYIFEPGSPISKEEAKQLCVERSKSDSFLAVELRVTHKMIGHLYFSRSEPIDFMTWELGYIFNPKYFNKGFCTEASRAIIKYAFNDLQAHRIEAFCNPLNAASWHVLEKAGMKREGFFKEKAFFRKDINDKPLWHDCYAYGVGDKEFKNI